MRDFNLPRYCCQTNAPDLKSTYVDTFTKLRTGHLALLVVTFENNELPVQDCLSCPRHKSQLIDTRTSLLLSKHADSVEKNQKHLNPELPRSYD